MPSDRPSPTTAVDPASPPAERADRRAFLKKAGIVGAGVAGATWAAPSVLALDKAFAAPGSCCTQKPLNVLAAPFGNGTNAVGVFNLAAQGLATTLTITASQADDISNTTCTPTHWITGVITNCQQGDDSAGQIPLCAVGTDKTPIVVKLAFNPAVRNLSFVLTDIDASPLNTVEYQERVTIAWTNTTGATVPVYTPGSNIVPNGTLPTNVYQANSATTNADSDVVTNNLTVDLGCGGKISSVTITSSNLNTNTPRQLSDTQGRYVGIAQIKFCI